MDKPKAMTLAEIYTYTRRLYYAYPLGRNAPIFDAENPEHAISRVEYDADHDEFCVFFEQVRGKNNV